MKVLVFDCRKVPEINCRKMSKSTCFLQHNVKIVKVFHKDVAAQQIVDRHYEGLVRRVANGEADGVIVAAMMCISRDIPDAFKKIGQMKVAGGVVISVDDGNDLDMCIKEVGVYGRS